MYRFNTISNTDLSNLIDEWIKNERDRKIMKRRLLDGITHERIAEEHELSVKQIYRITNKYTAMLYQLCKEWQAIG